MKSLSLTAVFLSLALGVVPSAVAADCPGADAPVTDTAVARAATLCLANEQRAAAGVATLAAISQLEASAQGYAEKMVVGRFFSHDDPSGASLLDRLRASGYAGASFELGGENLGWLGGAPTPRSMMNAWLASAGHRANLLDPRYRDTGVGVAIGTPAGVQGATFAQHFGARGSAAGPSAAGTDAAGPRRVTAIRPSRKASGKHRRDRRPASARRHR